jgi:hypothetical protein
MSHKRTTIARSLIPGIFENGSREPTASTFS